LPLGALYYFSFGYFKEMMKRGIKSTESLESNSETRAAQYFVLFGSLGDLSLRKIFPAWYQLECAGLLGKSLKILGVARDEMSKDQFQQKIIDALKFRVPSEHFEEDVCKRLVGRIDYFQLDFQKATGYQQLKHTIKDCGVQIIYYLATSPNISEAVCDNLYKTGAITNSSRIVVEKPIGHNLTSSKVINDKLASYFNEEQIYRIDHYLGKETVQNLIALRFGNSILSSQWNHNSIEYVEITAAESVGIEGRWSYYDDVGQMRDMIQSHLLQLLCLVAMEPPAKLNAQSIRNKKEQVLQALVPISENNVSTSLIRGQYCDGQSLEEVAPGYLNEIDAKSQSETETFICIRAEIANWRWSGTPFYLRTGKRMPEKVTEIVIHFKADSHFIFDSDQKSMPGNSLIIRLQPTEGISLQVLTKSQGLEQGMRLRRDPLHLDFSESQKISRIPDAYERLLLEVLKGDQSLFVSRNEVELAWTWCDQAIDAWRQSSQPLYPYSAGSYGPDVSKVFIQKYGHEWHEDR
jgi:glucose-6-phosphate 1-dehydrogenase